MTGETLGLVLSLATALFWAIAVVLFKRSGDTMEPIALNTFKNVVALSLMLLTAAVVPISSGTSARDSALLLASGAVGIGIADTLLFEGLNLIGASRQAIVDTLYSPAVVLLSYFFLGELLSLRDGFGGALILLAVVLASLPSGDRSTDRVPIARGQLVRGTGYSAASMILMAVAIVAVKPIVEKHDVLWCTMLRLTGGTVSLVLFALLRKETRSPMFEAFRPRAEWKYALPGSLMGTYFSLLAWIGAFKYAPAGVAALLNQTSTLFIVLFAAWFLRERLTPRLVLAVTLALAGSVVVLLPS